MLQQQFHFLKEEKSIEEPFLRQFKLRQPNRIGPVVCPWKEIELPMKIKGTSVAEFGLLVCTMYTTSF